MAGNEPPEYGTSYFGVRDVDAVQRDLDRFAEGGLNAVLHTVSEADQRYYGGTLKQIVAASRERDFRVYVNPWGVGNVFGGEALTEFPARYPDARQQLSNGDRVPAACFNAPTFQQFMRDWVDVALKLNPHVVFWDEPHWYDPAFREEDEPDNPWTCRCPHCQKKYRDQYGESMPEEMTQSVRAFRGQTLLKFLDVMSGRVSGGGSLNAVCLVATPTGEKTVVDPSRVAALDHLDVLSATPFWDLHGADPKAFVGDWADRITKQAGAHDLESQLWIQGFGLPDTPESKRQFQTALRTARSRGPDSLMIWGWDACRVMSSIRCEAPESYWELFLEEIRSSRA